MSWLESLSLAHTKEQVNHIRDRRQRDRRLEVDIKVLKLVNSIQFNSILVIVAVSLLSIITAVSCNLVTANNTNNYNDNKSRSNRIDEQQRRHLTNINNDGDNLTPFIVGGTEITKGDYPYLVSIGKSGRRGGHGT